MLAAVSPPTRFRTLRPWLLAAFGRPVHRLALAAGSTCPNRDGTRGRGGCAYCGVEGSGTGALKSGLDLRGQLELGPRRVSPRATRPSPASSWRVRSSPLFSAPVPEPSTSQ
mgnify:CR=1 FL=1